MTVAVSGYFVILHAGHIDLLRKAYNIKCEGVTVILNNDKQQRLKYGRIIVPFREREKVLEDLYPVKEIIKSIDTDRTVCKTLAKIKPDIFCNGGDRHNKEIPEAKVCKKLGIKMVDGLGKKVQSASKLIRLLEK